LCRCNRTSAKQRSTITGQTTARWSNRNSTKQFRNPGASNNPVYERRNNRKVWSCEVAEAQSGHFDHEDGLYASSRDTVYAEQENLLNPNTAKRIQSHGQSTRGALPAGECPVNGASQYSFGRMYDAHDGEISRSPQME